MSLEQPLVHHRLCVGSSMKCARRSAGGDLTETSFAFFSVVVVQFAILMKYRWNWNEQALESTCLKLIFEWNYCRQRKYCDCDFFVLSPIISLKCPIKREENLFFTSRFSRSRSAQRKVFLMQIFASCTRSKNSWKVGWNSTRAKLDPRSAEVRITVNDSLRAPRHSSRPWQVNELKWLRRRTWYAMKSLSN